VYTGVRPILDVSGVVVNMTNPTNCISHISGMLDKVCLCLILWDCFHVFICSYLWRDRRLRLYLFNNGGRSYIKIKIVIITIKYLSYVCDSLFLHIQF